ncbi:MAG: site-specific DNA-methyltransferase, partial [Planctomycetaceae bacterium]|nr:site-specific DNA-methyltransferase [Planctomycetaceae bacterium]
MTRRQTFQNTFYTHDNLYVLSGLNSGLVDLIYLDPPFNTKRVYSASVGSKAAGVSFKDMWTWKDVDEHYLGTLAIKFPALARYIADVGVLHSKPMMAYLTYMAQRIIEMHRVLKDTGSLYLHCDPAASHYLKSVLDGIFGKNNFRNEIVWHRNEIWKKYSDSRFDPAADHIFFYTKTDKYTYIPQYIKSAKDPSNSYNSADEGGRKYRAVLITGHKSLGKTSKGMYKYRGYTPEYGWTVDKEKLIEMDEQGLLIWKDGICKNYKKYLDERTERVNSAWYDIVSARGKERTGYP